ncbi:MAG: Glu/Leu/Phe/Val dehydrogenase dimerization domain-containing protein [Phycisphaerales bacterium]|jgi:leucine dehydrogenase|nr:Glu/Leu/Phe/Val dehydrogenase dimerization domain-containing protein [Phycisphaerales bacterium]
MHDNDSIFEQLVDRGHERLCFHRDPETGLKAIVAIHSTALGNALGGTRRWYYESEADAVYDVLRLSKGMTYKAAVSGLPMGGAKSVIMMPHREYQRTENEAKAMGRFVDTFNGAYIAAEDVGVDTQFIDWMASETNHVMGGETVSRGGDPSPWTAMGTFHGMRACLLHAGRGDDFSGVTVAIQGVGHVGQNLCKLLTEAGANIFVADIKKKNLDFVVDTYGCTPMHDADILTAECDILAPCALGSVLDGRVIQNLRCSIVCGAANNILGDPEEDAVALKTAGIIYGPDFVVNAGGLIHLAGMHLGMSGDLLQSKNDEIFETTTQILKRGEEVSSTYAAAVDIAKQRISGTQELGIHAG